jgi:alanyl-tRNA synthetase
MRGEKIIEGMNKQLEIQKQLADIAALEVRPEGNEFEIFHAKRAMQRFKLEERLQQQIGEMREGAQKENAERAARETLRFFDNESTQKIQKLGMFLETKASKEREAREENSRQEAEALKKAEQAKIDAAKKVADKTLDLQTRLNIMLAEQAGDDEKARTLAIEARYRKMNEGATKAQQKIIQQMKAIELAGIAPAAADGGGGGTATVSTAIGSFTVASGAIETKKQTSLLKRIANATEKMGDKSTGVSVILAA